MKRFVLLCLALSFAAALAGAATHARYRIDLRHGGSVFSRDLPVHSGTVILFHAAAGGALTGLPAEDVVAIQTEDSQTTVRKQVTIETRSADTVVRSRVSAIQTLARPLEPGDILVIGPTGGGSAQVTDQAGNGSGAVISNGMNNGVPIGAYGYGGNASTPTGMVPPGIATNGQPFALAPGDVPRAASGNPPTMGPNGFPTNGNSTTINVGPNGTPVVAGSSQAAPQPGANQTIGPNGTPTLAQPGAPGATPPSIGPNGTPILAPSGAPGSSPPAIAPNGTPATGQPGTPSSAQPSTAPNGTPASPPPGGSSPKG